MFRFEVGAHILVRKGDWEAGKSIEVKVLQKAPRRIKAEILTEGWFGRGEIHWLADWEWIAVCRVKEK